MKGVILAGGMGTRLAPLTKDDNKHYLPVYDRRMIDFPLQTLLDGGIKDIIIVCGGKSPGKFIEYLGSGKSRGCKIQYVYQDGNGGIGEALWAAYPCLNGDPACVILGDNYFEDPIKLKWRHSADYSGARVFLRKTNTPWHFGIAEVSEGKIISIEEKPSEPKSDLAILGLYELDASFFVRLTKCTPSERGELEVTDLLNHYLSEGKLEYQIYDGYWSDMGTFETWTEVSQRVANKCIS